MLTTNLGPHRLRFYIPGLLLACVFMPRPVSCATMDTVAGTGHDANNGSPGSAVMTNVGSPFGVELGPRGALHITEVSNHRVWRLDPITNQLTVVAGTGKPGYDGDGGPATKASLNEPYEVRFDRDGNMYFVEMQNHIVRQVDAKTGRISTIAGNGHKGFAGDGGPALKAQLSVPHSIALDESGYLYIADIGNHRIRRVHLASGTIDTMAGNGEKVLPQDGQAARGKPMLGPRALFIRKRTMWIALREGHSVWRMDLDSGILHHIAGTGDRGYSGDGGPAPAATFAGPKGIAEGPQGNVFVVDTENHVIRRIDVKRHTVTTVAGNGQKGYGGDTGPATQARLDRPHGVCVGPDGAIYIGDTVNHRVRSVTGIFDF